MDFIPKFLIIGLYTPVPLPGSEGGKLVRAQINQIWADVTAKYAEYHQLQIAPDGSAAQFLGPTEASAVTIQPPLLQLREEIGLTPERSAEKAHDVFDIVARHIGAHQFFNLGVKAVYHAEPPDHDARGFLLHHVLGKTQEDVAELGTGGDLYAGVTYYLGRPQSFYKISVEPLLEDPRSLYIDIDARFEGPIELEALVRRAQETAEFVQGPLGRYLDKHIP